MFLRLPAGGSACRVRGKGAAMNLAEKREMHDRSETYIRNEIDHAWSHYRHTEELRFKYVSGLIALLTASFTVLLAASKYLLADKPTPQMVAGLALFILFLFGCSLVFLTGIIRIGYVLSAYEYILNRTRAHFCHPESQAHQIWQVRDRIPEPVKSPLFSLQNGAVLLTGMVCAFLGGAEIYLAVIALGNWSLVVPLASLVVILGLSAYVLRAMLKATEQHCALLKANKQLMTVPLTSIANHEDA